MTTHDEMFYEQIGQVPPRVDLWPGVVPLDAVVESALGPQTVDNLETELCKGIEPETAISTQDEFLTMLDELLDNTLHDDHCYAAPNDNACVCIIGVIRAVLPPCGAVYRPAHPQRGDRIVTCQRNAHPASPDRHVF